MKPLYLFIDIIRQAVRRVMHAIAVFLNSVSGGRLHPNTVTIFGLLMHLPIAYLIAIGSNIWAAVLLLVFGLFDTLDGELARLQKRASNVGMVLDASTDRFKEVFLYSGIAYALINSASPGMATWAVAACGFSISVSYVKAKGESAMTELKLSANEKNKSLFRDGLLTFEVRMFLLIVGLLVNSIAAVIVVISILSALTAFQRLLEVTRRLNAQN